MRCPPPAAARRNVPILALVPFLGTGMVLTWLTLSSLGPIAAPSTGSPGATTTPIPPSGYWSGAIFIPWVQTVEVLVTPTSSPIPARPPATERPDYATATPTLTSAHGAHRMGG